MEDHDQKMFIEDSKRENGMVLHLMTFQKRFKRYMKGIHLNTPTILITDAGREFTEEPSQRFLSKNHINSKKWIWNT